MVKDKPKIAPHLQPILESVPDPEIPVLTILDLGMIREATEVDGEVYVKLSPTYSGCPATDVIGDDIRTAFKKHNMTAHVEFVISPPWTTKWITEDGKRKMREYGIAPPLSESADKQALLEGKKVVPCTLCRSTNTHMVSQFGSTPCKALFKCDDCLEPFDYFKCLI
ncbi:MAG TPA: 1,2-phenylacetyl-CoA epoxidase subunit PaaD [Flavobacteriaceae bacterium]|nr:1,2-phenylacetyl-CoA epoxidase subunit PaaD [Flavobacteriaceae bacterium]